LLFLILGCWVLLLLLVFFLGNLLLTLWSLEAWLLFLFSSWDIWRILLWYRILLLFRRLDITLLEVLFFFDWIWSRWRSIFSHCLWFHIFSSCSRRQWLRYNYNLIIISDRVLLRLLFDLVFACTTCLSISNILNLLHRRLLVLLDHLALILLFLFIFVLFISRNWLLRRFGSCFIFPCRRLICNRILLLSTSSCHIRHLRRYSCCNLAVRVPSGTNSDTCVSHWRWAILSTCGIRNLLRLMFYIHWLPVIDVWIESNRLDCVSVIGSLNSITFRLFLRLIFIIILFLRVGFLCCWKLSNFW